MRVLVFTSLFFLVGCAYYNANDPTEFKKFWEVQSDFNLCNFVYPSFESNSFGAARSLEFRMGAFIEIENEMNRRDLDCADKFPSYERFKGKTKLETLKES